jgi:AcrB/AcrD/AcrF family
MESVETKHPQAQGRLRSRQFHRHGLELRGRGETNAHARSDTLALGLFPAAIATSIGSQAQKPLAIVVVGAMFCTLFRTRHMMPVLYSYFPAPRGTGGGEDDHLVEGTNYSRFFMHHFPSEA